MSKFKKIAASCALAATLFAGHSAITFAAEQPAAPAAAQTAVENASSVKNATFFISGTRSYYPVVKLPNVDAAFKIDREIQGYIGNLCAGIDSGKYSYAIMDYSVHYENSNLVSLVIKQYHYKDGAANGETVVYGNVYSKTTGQQISLKQYLNVSPEQLQEAITKGAVTVLGGNGTKALPLANLQKIESVPHNYFLNMAKNGTITIGLVFQPGSIAPYSDGIVHVLIPANEVQKLNSLN